MANEITDIDVLQEYLEGVMRRSEHHANEVQEVVLALIGAVVWKKDSRPLKVKQYAGRPANILWWYSKNNNKYAFRYDHNTSSIELRRNSYKGDVVATFDNTTSVNEIVELFGTL